MGEAIRRARKILSQPAMEEFNGGEISPAPAVDTDAEILDWVKRNAENRLTPLLHLPHGVSIRCLLLTRSPTGCTAWML